MIFRGGNKSGTALNSCYFECLAKIGCLSDDLKRLETLTVCFSLLLTIAAFISRIVHVQWEEQLIKILIKLYMKEKKMLPAFDCSKQLCCSEKDALPWATKMVLMWCLLFIQQWLTKRRWGSKFYYRQFRFCWGTLRRDICLVFFPLIFFWCSCLYFFFIFFLLHLGFSVVLT